MGEARTLNERVEVLFASVQASPSIRQVTLHNHFTCSSLSFLLCLGGSIPCPACLTDLSQSMGVYTHLLGGAASRVIGLSSNLSINLFLSCFLLSVVFLLLGWKQLLAALTPGNPYSHHNQEEQNLANSR